MGRKENNNDTKVSPGPVQGQTMHRSQERCGDVCFAQQLREGGGVRVCCWRVEVNLCPLEGD